MGKTKRSPVWDDPRVKPPYGSVAVDWGHPLAQGLRGYWLVNENAGLTLWSPGMATPLTMTQASGAPSWVTTASGGGLQWTNVYPQNARGTTQVFTFPWTFIVYFTTTSTAATDRTLISQAASSGLPYARLYINSTHLLRYVLVSDGGATSAGTISSVSYNTGTVYCAIATSRANNDHEVYANGVSDGTSSGSLGTMTFGATDFFLGLNGLNNGEPFDGTLLGGAVLSRGLNTPEAQQWFTEPYAVLHPIIRRRYFVPSGAAARVVPRRLLLLGVGS